MYIVIEGIDGSGKTSIAQLLTEWLKEKGEKVKLWSEPYLPEVHALLKKVSELEIDGFEEYQKGFKSDLYAMLFSTDRYLMLPELQKILDDGYNVVADRSYLSSMAYQYMTEEEHLRYINMFAEEPDIVLLLEASPEIALSRVEKRDGGEKHPFEKEDNLRFVKERYHTVMEWTCAPWYVVDADKPIDEVLKQCKSVITSYMGENEDYI